MTIAEINFGLLATEKGRVQYALHQTERDILRNRRRDRAAFVKAGAENFIAGHPGYVTPDRTLGRVLVEGGKQLLVDLPIGLQKIGGAIIRTQFDNEQISEIGRKG